MPVVLGNCVTYEVALNLMKAGGGGGVGGDWSGGGLYLPGCVGGWGFPRRRRVADCAAAREDYHAQTGRYVPVIADGGVGHRRGYL
jgi:IMP dehydrogenase